MNVKASDTNELLCDNNTVEIHHVHRSDLKKKKLGFLDKISRKTNYFYFQQSLQGS